ncbi:MAG: hypothetical protein MZV70_18830 [Desulfobacterales bacterium]|nr:hypothetical protein [Desulfobacterales bacterium]
MTDLFNRGEPIDLVTLDQQPEGERAARGRGRRRLPGAAGGRRAAWR